MIGDNGLQAPSPELARAALAAAVARREATSGHNDADHRIPPHDGGAEQATLGAMLLSTTAVETVAWLVTEKDFYRPAHQTIFLRILDVFAMTGHVCPSSVADHMVDTGELSRVGGGEYLHHLLTCVPVVENASSYAKIVLDLAYERRVCAAAEHLLNTLTRTDGPNTWPDVAKAYAAVHESLFRAYWDLTEADARAVIAHARRPGEDGPTALYRWFDADDRLLYVGITSSLRARQSSHAKKSSWEAFAVRATIERYPCRADAEQAELDAIRAERPLFNDVGNDHPDAVRDLVTYLAERGRFDLLAPAVSRG